MESRENSAGWSRRAAALGVGVALGVAVGLAACTPSADGPDADEPSTEKARIEDGEDPMSAVAETYVRLVLALGEHDADTVDAYLGPESWRNEVRQAAWPLAEIRDRVRGALGDLDEVDLAGAEPIEVRRHRNLERSLAAISARIEVLEGTDRSFDEESRALFDAVAPRHAEADFEAALSRLDALLPGEGPVAERYERFQADFVIPSDRLDSVFRTAVDACREKTRGYLDLPADESFEIEYVTGKSWSGYNWYKGGYHSLIQVNTDFPITIDRALDLACHEGYPGHHVYNLLVERDLVEARGWPEFSVYALFSPRSLIAEGTANYGIEVAFPGEERIAYERETLFPLAGLDPARTAEYYEIHTAKGALDYAGNEAARRYLDRQIDRETAADWLTRYALMPPDRAEQRTRFFDQYRTYVINYNLGQDLVRDYVEARVTDDDARWRELELLLREPILPSELSSAAGDPVLEHGPPTK